MSDPILVPAQPSTREIRAYAAQTATSPVAPYTIRRRTPTPEDVVSHIFVLGYGSAFVIALATFALPCVYLILTRKPSQIVEA